MGELYNLLRAQHKMYDGPVRNMDPAFGHDYFDGTRDQGYGGYNYDGRWKPIAEEVVKRYDLKPNSSVLDVGCAKGFFLYDLVQLYPNMAVRGIDVSEYAISKAPEEIKPFLLIGSADRLDFEDNSFDFVAAFNTIHFLTPERAKVALQEIMRVGRGNYFVNVDAFNNEREKERLLAWAPTIKTVYSVDQWKSLFEEVGYDGDYHWFTT